MSPEKARVFVVEDDGNWREMILEAIKYGGHEVVAISTTLQEALEAVGTLTELGIQVATIDGNLTREGNTGEDGKKILKAIRTHAPEVKTIGVSMNRMEGFDVDAGKENVNELGRIVAEI